MRAGIMNVKPEGFDKSPREILGDHYSSGEIPSNMFNMSVGMDTGKGFAVISNGSGSYGFGIIDKENIDSIKIGREALSVFLNKNRLNVVRDGKCSRYESVQFRRFR